jgi:UDP-N-acetylglucosamine--N-acetylmuramyl-(pentapeptide) pyrophosphoryl-undecaprenol N-acetylglucosamine transferase
MAGGTGGHVFPALACAREFQARGYSVHWLGTPRGIENELVPRPAAAAPDPGQRPARQGQAVAAQGAVHPAQGRAAGTADHSPAQAGLRVGFGGYVTGPGGVAARLCGVPLVIHEQNAVAGTANRLLVPLSARVCEAFPNTFASDKRRTTGNPVRPSCSWTRTAPWPSAGAPAGPGRQPGRGTIEQIVA